MWWISSIVGLQQGLVIHFENLRQRQNPDFGRNHIKDDHPERVQQPIVADMVSPTPQDLTEDRRLNKVLTSAEHLIEEYTRAQNAWQRNRVNPLPQTKNQLKKAGMVKRLREK